MAKARDLQELSAEFGLAPGCEASVRLQKYLGLLRKWNARINLTASTDWEALGWLFAEALWAARLYPPAEKRHLDIGSGGGFPALPMKIMVAGMRLCMVESRARRAAFLETAVEDLGLEGVEVFGGRIETFLENRTAESFDIVSCKGIKVSREALALLEKRSGPATRLWVFHGAALPFADPHEAERRLRLEERHASPARPGHYLSVYHVSRETDPD